MPMPDGQASTKKVEFGMGVVPLDGGEKEMTRLGVKGVGKPLTIVLNV